MMLCVPEQELEQDEAKPKSISVPPESFAALDELVAWSRKTQKVVVAEVFAWLGWLLKENPDAAGAIVHHLPSSRRPEFARLILERMAEEDATPKPDRLADPAGLGEVGAKAVQEEQRKRKRERRQGEAS